jgi:uncharacterized protein YbbC (DUF1343 family)
VIARGRFRAENNSTAVRGAANCFARMAGAFPSLTWRNFLPVFAPLVALLGCSSSQPPRPVNKGPIVFAPASGTTTRIETQPPVMLGIDVLEAEGFAAIKGKRIGLLTHPAGVNRRGIPTVDVLRQAPGVRLVALFSPEHGIYGETAAATNIGNTTDRRTGLPVYSLYKGNVVKPTAAQLKGIDAFVIDLQDIGTRSYTFASSMKRAMEGCFENNVEVIVLDRPNPLGGLKVDGPLLDANLISDVGRFRVPYVHGLTIGELARMAKEAPSLDLPEAVRARGRLTVIPMRGWTRAMRWPETGLTWIPTSGGIQDWAAVQGYPMLGLGTYFDLKSKFDIGFRSGVGTSYIFRGISCTNPAVKIEVLERELRALNVPGIQFRRVSAIDRSGKSTTGIYVEIVDYDDWRPAELNFYLMKLACKLDPKNPFAAARGRSFEGFLRHMGSAAFLSELATKGARVDVNAWLQQWREQARIYQEQSRRYWLYR